MSKNEKESIAKIISESLSGSALLDSVGKKEQKEIKKGNKKEIMVAITDDSSNALEEAGYKKEQGYPLLRYALDSSQDSAKKKAPSLAFTEDPIYNRNYSGLFRQKRGNLLPDAIIKDISVQDHLVASILRIRGGMASNFGHIREDRFSPGIEVAIKPEIYEVLTPEQFSKIKQKIKEFEQILINCGYTQGLEHHDRTNLANFLDVQMRNGLRFGRFATEIIYDRDAKADKDGKYPFNRFRARDVATIYPILRKNDNDNSNDKLRQEAIKYLSEMLGEKPSIDLNKLAADHYAWMQLIDGQKKSAFTHDEMLVFNLFDSTDVEHCGYPVAPLSTVVNSITTHVSIDAYRKLYFQNGRATRGMLVIKSDEIDQQTLEKMKLEYNASINGVSNSFRSPLFGMAKEDDIAWISMAGEGAQDRDFQYMSDEVSRNILSAFGMSPDEVPGFGHLSRGTNAQTLSESNNEYKLTASRDAGLRSLLVKFENFLNQHLFPIIDPILAKICEIRICGLDAESKEQESTRLQQDMPTHMSYDEVLHKVDKTEIGQAFGGKVPFNERYRLILDSYMEVGSIKNRFFDDPAASVDPLLRYKRDPFWLQTLQLLSQINPVTVKALFACRPYALDILKMQIEDTLED